MPADNSQLDTFAINDMSSDPLNETTLPPQSSLIGKTLDGRYVVEKELGRGGVGAVYLARDRTLHDRRVVIKLLLDRSLENSWVVQKFQQEKEALARVDHPGVVGVLGGGELPNGQPYIVMQFVDGVTLRSQIQPEGMPLDRAGEIIKQIGRALSAAHEKGIFHRDLKPENIMLQSFGHDEEQVKIIDFGIAKLKDSMVAPSTMTGATAGTVAYMAPEQLSGRTTSASTDIYAFGAIAYEITTGRKPFNPETGFELLEMQRRGVRISASDLRPAVSSEASELIMRALSFEPSTRFQTAREFGDALARALNDEVTREQQVSPARIPATQLATQANPPVRQTADLDQKTIAGRYEPAQVDTLNQPAYAAAIEAEPQSRTGSKIAVALIGLVIIGVIAGVLFWKREAIFGGGASRSLNYSLTVQKMRDDKPYQGEFESSGQEIFENGWKFRMNMSSPQEGYLYLINEGPVSGDTMTYNVLFPESQTNGGSSHVSANQKLQTAWMRFDDHQGTEKFWMVWSSSPVKELQAVNDAANDKDRGEIRDAAKSKSVRDFLSSHSSQKLDVSKDSAKKQTTVSGKANVLVNLIELEHH